MVRPDWRPLLTSRGVRVMVARGSMAYSAVTQPEPLPRRKEGTPSSIEAAQSTWVFPKETRTDPVAWGAMPG